MLVLAAMVGVARTACPAVPAETSEPSAPSPSFFGQDDWRAGGWSLTNLGDAKALACGPGGRRCICLQPLPCGTGGSAPACASFEENIAAFRSALKKGQDGRTVVCRRAEIGRCGSFRYFHFAGDIERTETRWFDSGGRLLAQRNRSDYPAYCDAKADLRFLGPIPRCDSMERTELLCGTVNGPAPVAPAALFSNIVAPVDKPFRHDREPVR
jgi:hypothetical protein